MKEPVVVIGMHRSGTSLVAQMLERLGLFIGRVRDPNDEATFFLKANEWLLRQSGGAWDHPQSIDAILQTNDARERYVCLLEKMLQSPRAILYLGGWCYLRNLGTWVLHEPWGWKDPRTTLTLPLWQEVFPRLKVVHVVRHGLDVALSLRARERRKMEQWNEPPNGWMWGADDSLDGKNSCRVPAACHCMAGSRSGMHTSHEPAHMWRATTIGRWRFSLKS